MLHNLFPLQRHFANKAYLKPKPARFSRGCYCIKITVAGVHVTPCTSLSALSVFDLYCRACHAGGDSVFSQSFHDVDGVLRKSPSKHLMLSY